MTSTSPGDQVRVSVGNKGICNNSTIAAYLSGQVELIASGSVVMAAIAEKNPAKVPVMKVKLKDSPVYVGLAKNEPALIEV